MTDSNELRDKIQDMIVDAYGDLNIACYARALVQLEIAVEELRGLAEWERGRDASRGVSTSVAAR